MNILVMSGTREAKQIISKLSKRKDMHITATTTTSYGSSISAAAGAQEVIPQRLPQEEIVDLIAEKNIELLIDATHPFAVNATKNALNAAQANGIKYIRFERPSLKIKDHPSVFKTNSFQEASLIVSKLDKGNLLHLAGVSNLNQVLNYNSPDRVYIRVLPSLESIKKCMQQGLDQDHIIAMQGTFSKSFNKSLLQEYDISVIITKESGKIGGTDSKIEAALELGLNVVLVLRPQLKELSTEKVVQSIEELLNFLKKLE